MDRGHSLIITIILVNTQIVSPGHGLDYVRSMDRDNRRPLCGEVGTESGTSNLNPSLRSKTRPSEVSISPEGQYRFAAISSDTGNCARVGVLVITSAHFCSSSRSIFLLSTIL